MFRIICTLVALVVFSPITHAQKRVALVVGNSAYQFTSKLPNPSNDARDMTTVLKKHGFQVIAGFDLDKAAFDRKVRDFATALKGAEAGVFFYAGHGLQVAGQNYLVPIDAKAEAAEAVDFEMIRVDVVHRVMERQSTTNILFLDACRDNPLARNLARTMGTRSAEIGRGLAPVESGVRTLISFSTQPGNVALDGTGRNSPFAGSLVKRLASADDDLSAILIAVRNDVMKATQRKQVPWEHSALTGRFYFSAKSPQQLPNPALARPNEAAEAWDLVRDSTSATALEAFASRFSDSFLADLARARIEDLKTQATVTASATPPAPRPDITVVPEADLVRSIRADAKRVTSVAISKDGRLALAGGEEKIVRLFDLDNGNERGRFEGHNSSIQSVDFSRDTRLAISGACHEVPKPKNFWCDEGVIKLWDLAGGEIRSFTGHTGAVRSASFSSDDQLVVSGADDKTVRLWEVKSGKQLRVLEGHSSTANAVSLSADGRFALSSSWDEQPRLWDLSVERSYRKLESRLPLRRRVSSALSADGQYAVAGGCNLVKQQLSCEKGAVTAWHAPTGRELWTATDDGDLVEDVAISADGQVALSGSKDGAKLWDVPTGRLLCTFRGWTFGAAISQDNRRAITASHSEVLVWDLLPCYQGARARK